MSRSHMNPAHTVLIDIIPPFFKQSGCQMRNIQKIEKFLAVCRPQLCLFGQHISFGMLKKITASCDRGLLILE